jgi:hypothetical protein
LVITGHTILNHSPWLISPWLVAEHIGYAPDCLPAPLARQAFCSAAWNKAAFQIVISLFQQGRSSAPYPMSKMKLQFERFIPAISHRNMSRILVKLSHQSVIF